MATTSLIAGGLAGLAVDTALFPVDTLKTRLQSQQGFRAAGGFSGVYRGLGAAALGSVPAAALFFATYDSVKRIDALGGGAGSHMAAATAGEGIACLVRVPTEVVKQRRQTGVRARVEWRGMYRGFFATILREIPFTCIQFPIYEKLKAALFEGQQKLTIVQGGVCGCIAGGFAAGVTTPLDVIKTRRMLSESKEGWVQTAKGVWKEGAMFRGVVPRVIWIGAGGFVFLGVYEHSKSILEEW